MMSGSIACAKASSLISAWTKSGHSVRVACTRSVSEFVGPATLEGLSGETVFSDTWASGQAMDHIALAQWADWIVVCPATANLINKFAAGIADDAVTTLWQGAWGRGKPMFVVPAMNTRMWNYPATRLSVARLQEWGVHVLPTATGDLACGEQGEGRMLEPPEIQARIERLLDYAGRLSVPETPAGKRILITAGGTREPIDDVRYIGNHSTGRTAAALCDSLAAAGHRVTWLGAETAKRPTRATQEEVFVSFADLEQQLRHLLGTQHFDWVVHAAAVSDFSVAEILPGAAAPQAAGTGKLSSREDVTLRLARNPKLLDRIRSFSCHPDVGVIGFKLTAGADPVEIQAAVQRLFAQAGTDAVVHNDLAEINAERHGYTLHLPDGRSDTLDDSRELAQAIGNMVG